MRTRAALLALSLLFILPATGHALSIFAGYWNAEDFDDGFGLGVEQTKGIALVDVGGRISWFHFSGDGADVNIVPLEAVGKIKFGLFYGGLGLGWYFYDQSIKNNVGAQVFGGVKLALASLGVFGELRYVVAQGELAGVDLKANGIGVNVGVTLPIGP